MSGEFIGAGGFIAVNSVATPAVFEHISGATAFDTPSLAVDDIEVTALDSLGKEFISGMGDPGTMTFNINMRKKSTGGGYLAIQERVEAMVNDRLTHSFEIGLPAPVNTTYTIDGYVKSFRISGGPNTAVVAAVVVKFSGAPVRAVAP